MDKESTQMKIADIENKIASVEAEMAHLDLESEASNLQVVKARNQGKKDELIKEMALLRQELIDAKAEHETTKRFKRQVCLNNVDYLLNKQNKKLGELEISSGNRPGYLSRMKSGKSNSDPSIEFLMTAAEELDVPLELLVSSDLTQMSATEEFIITFLRKLIEDTQKDELVWTRETPTELEKLEVDRDNNGYSCVGHPLYKVEEQHTDVEYFEFPTYNSLFFPNCGVKPCGNGYNAYLTGTNNHIYIMECGKGDDRLPWASDIFFEIYMVQVDRYSNTYTKKLCNTLEMSSPIVTIVNSLVKNIITSLNRVHIESDVRNVIDAYIKGLDIMDSDDEDLPFR